MSSEGFTEVGEEEIRRERQKARELRKSQWWKRRRSTGVCHYCGDKVAPRQLTMDHVVPIVRGGKSTKGNIVPACKACNNKKKHSLLMDWEEYVNR
jgi:5-methylcytosine-specific restriction endonuclease McrA